MTRMSQQKTSSFAGALEFLRGGVSGIPPVGWVGRDPPQRLRSARWPALARSEHCAVPHHVARWSDRRPDISITAHGCGRQAAVRAHDLAQARAQGERP